MRLEKKIGLVGAIGIVTGGVIGMGAYALIPGIAANAGSGAWFAILVALVVSIIGVLPLIQIASALPVAGGGYIYCSRLISPLSGVIVSFYAIIGGASSLCLIGLGLAGYIKHYFPNDFSSYQIAFAFIVIFYFIYLFGLRLLTALQVIMAIIMLLSLLMYAGVLLYHNDFKIILGAPESIESFGFATILAFNVCMGFQIIIEMGEELRKPEKNIPLALVAGALVILFIYIAILSAYMSEVGLEILSQKISLAKTAEPYFTGFLNVLFIIGVFCAGITSYNAGAITLPREIFSMGRDKTLPQFFSKVNAITGNPTPAVSVFFVFILIVLSMGRWMEKQGIIEPYFGNGSDALIEFFGFMTILGIMMLTIFICIAAFRLPKLYPEPYKNAYLKIPVGILKTLVVLSIIFSSVLIVMMCTKVIVAVIYAAYTVLVLGYFFYRKKYLSEKGISIGKYYDVFGEK